MPSGRAFRRLNRRSEEKRRMSCRQAFRRRCEAIAREAVGAVPATMFRPALAGRMIGATLLLRTSGSRARNFPGRRFRARRSPWWTLWTGLGAAGCPQVHRGRGLRLKKKEAVASFRIFGFDKAGPPLILPRIQLSRLRSAGAYVSHALAHRSPASKYRRRLKSVSTWLFLLSFRCFFCYN